MSHVNSYWACSILECLLRKPIPDSLLLHLLLHLPFPPSPPSSSPPPPPLLRLRRTLLVRRIISDPFSSGALLSLEHLHALSPANPHIPTAYLHSAVGSTLLQPLGSFSDAVERTWRMRIGDLHKSSLSSSSEANNGLPSEALMKWKRRMETAETREELLKTWNVEDGRNAVKECLAWELEALGPTVIDMMAEAVLQGRDANEALGSEAGVRVGDEVKREVGATSFVVEDSYEEQEEQFEVDMSVREEEEGVGEHEDIKEMDTCRMRDKSRTGEQQDLMETDTDMEAEGRALEPEQQLGVDVSIREEMTTDEQARLQEVDISIGEEETIGKQEKQLEMDSGAMGKEQTDKQAEQQEVDVRLRDEERTGEQAERLEGISSDGGTNELLSGIRRFLSSTLLDNCMIV